MLPATLNVFHPVFSDSNPRDHYFWTLEEVCVVLRALLALASISTRSMAQSPTTFEASSGTNIGGPDEVLTSGRNQFILPIHCHR